MRQFKDIYAVRTLKYHLYKKYRGTPRWNAEYLFERDIRRCRPSDTLVDFGANLGTITARMAATGAKVIAFEPDPYTFEKLKENTAGFSNITYVQKAISVENGSMKMYRNVNFAADRERYSESTSLLSMKKNVSTDDAIDVEVVDIVDFIDSVGPIKLMKMDVEGAELSIITRMLDSKRIAKVGRLYAETHERQIPDLAAQFGALRQRAKSHAKTINLEWK